MVQGAIVAENKAGRPGPGKTMSGNQCWADGKTIHTYVCCNTYICPRCVPTPVVVAFGALASRQLLWVQRLFMLYSVRYLSCLLSAFLVWVQSTGLELSNYSRVLSC